MTPPVEETAAGAVTRSGAAVGLAAADPGAERGARSGTGPAAGPAVDLLRPARPGDVEAMAALINRYAAMGLMLPKSPSDLYRLFREFVVVEGPDGEVAGCGGLRVYSDDLAEIVGLAVHEGGQGRGTGRRIVERLVDEATTLGVRRVFAMTLQEPFFHRLGFETTVLAWIPEKVSADCRTCARRAGCREIAVVRILKGEIPAGDAPLPVRSGRRLRVVAPRC